MERFKYNPQLLFELAGKRNPQEVRSLISSVARILIEETEAGRNKLGRNIDETRTSENGQEYFVDGKIVYLPPKGRAIFIGDTHGDSLSTESIVKQVEFIEDMESGARDMILVFLGDYADRGRNDVRNLEIILALKESYPTNVILLRGNHEEYDMSKRSGLSDSLRGHFSTHEGESVFNTYHNLFNLLPNIAITGNGIVAVHGGIPIDQIEDLFTLRDNESLFEQIRWNDPDENIEGIRPSNRGWGTYEFGHDIFENFIELIKGKVMIRSHEYPRDGYKLFFDGRLVTIFSNGGKSSESSYFDRVQPKILCVSLASPIVKIMPQNIVDVKLTEC